jgi:hypothetical protein
VGDGRGAMGREPGGGGGGDASGPDVNAWEGGGTPGDAAADGACERWLSRSDSLAIFLRRFGIVFLMGCVFSVRERIGVREGEGREESRTRLKAARLT